ncbi:MAG: hypothetical protein EB060_06630 [Proteobacteria bacterium]|nr:hypothetical protein [Pseudomonadota bacterium]
MALNRLKFGYQSGIEHLEEGVLPPATYELAYANFEALYEAHVPNHIQSLIHLSDGVEKIQAIVWKNDNSCTCVTVEADNYTYLVLPTEKFARFTHDPALDATPVNPFATDTTDAVRDQLNARCRVVEEVHHAAFVGLENRPGWREAVAEDFASEQAVRFAAQMRSYFKDSQFSQKVALTDGVYEGKEHIEAIPDLLHAYGYFRDINIAVKKDMHPQIMPLMVLGSADDRMMELYPKSWPMMKAYDRELKERASALEEARYTSRSVMPDAPTPVYNAAISDIDEIRERIAALKQWLATLPQQAALSEAQAAPFDLAAAVASASTPDSNTPNTADVKRDAGTPQIEEAPPVRADATATEKPQRPEDEAAKPVTPVAEKAENLKEVKQGVEAGIAQQANATKAHT